MKITMSDSLQLPPSRAKEPGARSVKNGRRMGELRAVKVLHIHIISYTYIDLWVCTYVYILLLLLLYIYIYRCDIIDRCIFIYVIVITYYIYGDIYNIIYIYICL